VQGQLSLFTPRGSYQLIARVALPEGLGELHAQFERTRKKLEAEGLLAPERKRPLPHLPRVLGVVTSSSGAALHDIIRVANERSPVRIVISPCSVQGSEAPMSIVRALALVQKLPLLDAVIVGRGGGAAEDLLAFNDERVARAIAGCRVPTISAVGHEVDITIADLVADVRASTPSNAAELAMPDRRALLAELRSAERGLMRASEVRLGRARLRLSRLEKRLRDPRVALRTARGRFEDAEHRLNARLRHRVRLARSKLAQLNERLQRADPRLLLAQRRQRLVRLQTALQVLRRPLLTERRQDMASLQHTLQVLGRPLLTERRQDLSQLQHTLQVLGRPLLTERRQKLAQLQSALHVLGRPLYLSHREKLGRLCARLDTLSPLASLARGYAIVLHAKSGKALLRARDTAAGDMLEVRLSEGTLRARVEPS
jgi:exodeoxyribonuclease VII large subunit